MNTVSWVQTRVIGHPQRKLNDQWLPQLSVPFYSNWNKTKQKLRVGGPPPRSKEKLRCREGGNWDPLLEDPPKRQLSSSFQRTVSVLYLWMSFITIEASCRTSLHAQPTSQRLAGIGGSLGPPRRACTSGRGGKGQLSFTAQDFLKQLTYWIILSGDTHKNVKGFSWFQMKCTGFQFQLLTMKTEIYENTLPVVKIPDTPKHFN